VPAVGQVFSVVLLMSTVAVLAICISKTGPSVEREILPLTSVAQPRESPPSAPGGACSSQTGVRPLIFGAAIADRPVLFAIYIDSFTFVFLTAVLTKGFNMNANISICRGVILLCQFPDLSPALLTCIQACFST
jgi:hypothetical protein